jgi:hypothetical protein
MLEEKIIDHRDIGFEDIDKEVKENDGIRIKDENFERRLIAAGNT